MTRTFDLEKAMRNGGKCVTRDGLSARIICTDALGNCNGDGRPLVVLVKTRSDYEEVRLHATNGRDLPSLVSEYDLLNLPEKKKGWIAHKAQFGSESRLSTGVFYEKKDLLDWIGDEKGWITQEIEWTEE